MAFTFKLRLRRAKKKGKCLMTTLYYLNAEFT